MAMPMKDEGMGVYIKLRADQAGRKNKGEMFKEEMKKNAGGLMDKMMGSSEDDSSEDPKQTVVKMLEKCIEILSQDETDETDAAESGNGY